MAASELPNIDPEPDATIPWSYEALNAPQFSPGATDTSSADELPRGHPEAAAELRLSSSPSLGVTSDRELEAITDLATHPGTMFDRPDSGIFQTEPLALNGSLDSSQHGLGHIFDSPEQGFPDSAEQDLSNSLAQEPEQGHSPEQTPSNSPEQRHPNFPEPGHNSSLEQDLTDSPAQGPEQGHQDPPEQGRPDSLEQDVDGTPRGSTPFTPAEGRSANDASTVLGLLTPNDSPSKVLNSAAENLRSAP